MVRVDTIINQDGRLKKLVGGPLRQLALAFHEPMLYLVRFVCSMERCHGLSRDTSPHHTIRRG